MKQLAQMIALGLLSTAMGACSSAQLTPERQAMLDAVRDYTRIVQKANLLYATDHLAYPPGETTPKRIPVNCNQTDICSVGFLALLSANSAFQTSVGHVEVPRELNGVRAVVESGSLAYSDFYDFGGWMEHSFFFSGARLFTNQQDPDIGSTRVSVYANGFSTGENPTVVEGTAAWQGFVSARDSSVTESIENYVAGDATISVALDGEAPLADVLLSNLRNVSTGTEYHDINYAELALHNGRFERVFGENDYLRGAFYGPDQEEVAGTFEHWQGLIGAYGGKRKEQ